MNSVLVYWPLLYLIITNPLLCMWIQSTMIRLVIHDSMLLKFSRAVFLSTSIQKQTKLERNIIPKSHMNAYRCHHKLSHRSKVRTCCPCYIWTILLPIHFLNGLTRSSTCNISTVLLWCGYVCAHVYMSDLRVTTSSWFMTSLSLVIHIWAITSRPDHTNVTLNSYPTSTGLSVLAS